MSKYITTEGLLAVVGGLWFVFSSLFPAIPASMPIPALIPGLSAITPGLLCLGALVPFLLKFVNPATTPFINHPSPTREDVLNGK